MFHDKSVEESIDHEVKNHEDTALCVSGRRSPTGHIFPCHNGPVSSKWTIHIIFKVE